MKDFAQSSFKVKVGSIENVASPKTPDTQLDRMESWANKTDVGLDSHMLTDRFFCLEVAVRA